MAKKSTARRSGQPLRLSGAALASVALLVLLWGTVINRNGQISLGGHAPSTAQGYTCLLLDDAPVVISVTKNRRVFIRWGDSARQLRVWQAAAAEAGLVLSAEQRQHLAQQPYVGVAPQALPAYFASEAPAQSRQAARGMEFDSALVALRMFARLAYGQPPRGLAFCLDADESLPVADIRRIGHALRPYPVRRLYALTTRSTTSR